MPSPNLMRAAAPVALAALALFGCRGQISEQPPVQWERNMFLQPRLNPYGENDFYPDHRNMRPVPEGTVALGMLKDDPGYYQGGTDTAHFLAKNPRKITFELLERGQERFNIYCSPCHGRTGMANGIVVQRGFLPPPSFHDDRIVNMPDGQVFWTITNGVRNMPSYRKQVPEDDRWAIVAYLRALQRSQRATLADVPEDERNNLK